MSQDQEGLPGSTRRGIASGALLVGLAMIVLLVVLAMFMGGLLLRNGMRERAFNDCLKEPQRGSLITLRFDWWFPPGYTCVYRNDKGQIVREERP